MCGFVSIVNSNLNTNKLNNIFNKLSGLNFHRGPDDINKIEKKKYSILFRRLKIIDLSKNANQPFLSNDGKIVLVFNGEIYNYLELKNELELKNISFNTSSDTEVLLKSYEVWGLDFIKKIRGMFSFIIFDERINKIYCFRDHLGQKPFYYSFFSEGLILSSEIKDIILVKNKNEINENEKVVLKYLLRGWSDDTNETFYKDIFTLPAGCMGIIEGSKIKIKKYWKLKINQNKKFDLEEFNYNFNQNINLHLRADVPIAFTLSGGLDSSSIVKTSLENKNINYKAFSFNSEYEEENDEKIFIDEFIKENSLNHSYVDCREGLNGDILEKILSLQDEPINAVSFVNQFLLREHIHKQGYKVLLVGEGGDELLGGYNRMFIPFINSVYLNKNKPIPQILIDNIKKNLGSSFLNFKKNLDKYKDILNRNNDIEDLEVFNFLKIKESNIPSDLKFYNDSKPDDENSFKKFLYCHLFKRDLPHILRLEDRISMGNSIENRTPFVDYKFMEYVFSLNESFFMKDGFSKYMLRKIMNDKLPHKYFHKKKIGRPGSSKVMIFNNYYEKFCDYLNSFQDNIYFDPRLILDNLRNDKKNLKYRSNNDSYFRILNYVIWKNNLQSNLI